MSAPIQDDIDMHAPSIPMDPELEQALSNVSGVKRTRNGDHKHASSAKRANKSSLKLANVVRDARRKRYARAQPHIVSTNQAYLDTPLAGQQVDGDMHAMPDAVEASVEGNMHFDANLDPALSGTADLGYGLDGQDQQVQPPQQPPQYVNGIQIDPSAHPPLAPGQADAYPLAQGASSSTPGKKGRGVTRFWLNNSSIASSIAAQRLHPSKAGIRMPGDLPGDDRNLSAAEADAARAQQAAQLQQQTEASLRQGAAKFGRRKVTEASRSHARDAFTLVPQMNNNGYGIGVGVGVGISSLADQYPPMNVEMGLQEGEQQEFELPYDIQWAAENGELDSKKRPSTYQKIYSNYFGERSRLGATATSRSYDEVIDDSLASRPAVNVKVQWTSDKGHGLFAQDAIAVGQFVIDYRGEVVSLRTYLSRCAKQYTKSNCFYAIGYDQDEVLDAGIRANEARFVNHSCMPNLELRRVSLLGQGVDEYEFGFWATRDIMAGEELTFDYNETTWLPTKSTECRCGAPNCAKVLGRRPGDRTRREFRLIEAVRRSAGKARLERLTRKKLRLRGDSAAMSKYKAEIAELRRLRMLRHAEADALLESQSAEAQASAEEPAPPPAPPKKRKGRGRKAVDENAPPQTAEEIAAAAEEAKKARISGWAEWLRKKAGEQTRTADEWLEFCNKRRRGKAWMQRMMQEFGVAEYPGGPAMPFEPTIEIPKNGQPNKRGPPPGTPRPPRASKKDKLAKAAEAAAAEQHDAVKTMEDEGGEPGSSTGPGTHEGELAAAGLVDHLMGQGGHEHVEHQQVQVDEHGQDMQVEQEQMAVEQGQEQVQDGMVGEQHVEHVDDGEGAPDLDAAIDPALIAALVEHHQRQAEYDAGQPPVQGVGIGVGVGVGVGTGVDDGSQHAADVHEHQQSDTITYDEHGHGVDGGYDFFADVGVGSADDAALALAAAEGVLHVSQGHELGQEHEQHVHDEEHQMRMDGEQELENAVLRQQAEDIVSSILPRHLQ